MIRRHVGSEWWLVTQHDHALLAGELARHVGGAILPLAQETIQGIAQHDAGWQQHDSAPTLNDRGQPLDVFESPLSLGLKMWRRSSQLATTIGDYPALLVSLHSLSLSAHAAAKALPGKPTTIPELRLQFDLNKFQHAEVELQENCRRNLGMRLDIPLTLGLAHDSMDPAEQQLLFDSRWLSAMDQLSLDLCCTHAPFAALSHLTAHPGGPDLQLMVSRTGLATLCVSPWPFTTPWLDVSVPFRRIPDRSYLSREQFLEDFNTAPVEAMHLRLDPPGPLAAAG